MARSDALSKFLNEVGARCNWEQRIAHVGVVECYAANGKIFLVERYRGDSGWDLFIPASVSGKIDVTLEAARAYITGSPFDKQGFIRKDAAATGLRLARKIFAERGNHTEAHIREEELAVMLAAAFELGRAA